VKQQQILLIYKLHTCMVIFCHKIVHRS